MSSPPDAESRRPHRDTGRQQTRQSLDAKIQQVTDNERRHGTRFRHWRRFDCNRRRREHDELKRLLDHSKWNDLPSTFGLGADELRRHANRLVLEQGWSVDEVAQVLDVEPAGAR
jgi:hypothetical protein